MRRCSIDSAVPGAVAFVIVFALVVRWQCAEVGGAIPSRYFPGIHFPGLIRRTVCHCHVYPIQGVVYGLSEGHCNP